VRPTLQDLSSDTTFSQIKSHVPVPLREDSKGSSGQKKLMKDKEKMPYL